MHRDLLCSALGLPESALGSAQRSTGLVEITAALAADLAILSETLDGTGPDIAEALGQLVADARLAVRSYIGLTLIARHPAVPLNLTELDRFATPDDVVSSLMMPLSSDGHDSKDSQLLIVLYAARSGAFVDLAADLSWLTGRPMADFALDQHLHLPAEADSVGSVQAASAVNQAIGVLIGRGYTPDEATVELDARAAAAGHGRTEAARAVLSDPPSGDVGILPG